MSPIAPNKKVLRHDAFRLGLLERMLLSKEWSADLGGASGVEIVSSKLEKGKETSSATYGAKVAAAEFETNEIQDLADCVSAIKKAAAGQQLRFNISVELGDKTTVPQGVIDQVKALLAKVKAGWELG